jgi:hypothetical protein
LETTMSDQSLVDIGSAAIEKLVFPVGMTPFSDEGRKLIANAILSAAATARAPRKQDSSSRHEWYHNSNGCYTFTENGIYECFASDGKAVAYRTPRDGGGRQALSCSGSTIEDAIEAAEQEDAIITALAISPTAPLKTPLRYRPNDFDDWGMIRNSDGSMFATVKRPISVEEANEARRTNSDPFEGISLLLIAAVEGIFAEPLNSRKQLIELCGAVANLEKKRNLSNSEDIEVPNWERVAAKHYADAAERIQSSILLLADTFAPMPNLDAD